MKVKHILQSKGADVFAVKPDDTIEAAVGVLNSKNIGAVMVCDDGGKAVGILSERDVVRRLGEKGPETLAMRVSECMTANPQHAQCIRILPYCALLSRGGIGATCAVA